MGLLKWTCPKLSPASHSIFQTSFFSFLVSSRNKVYYTAISVPPSSEWISFCRLEARGQHRRSSLLGVLLICLALGSLRWHCGLSALPSIDHQVDWEEWGSTQYSYPFSSGQCSPSSPSKEHFLSPCYYLKLALQMQKNEQLMHSICGFFTKLCKIPTTIGEIDFNHLHEDYRTKNKHKYYKKWMSQGYLLSQTWNTELLVEVLLHHSSLFPPHYIHRKTIHSR